MKYVIMCGGRYKDWAEPRQLSFIGKERVIERTIRLLRENGVNDISISTNDSIFEQFGVPVLRHYNSFIQYGSLECNYWTDAFYPICGPACYIMGDVVFSPEAIQTIVSTETDDIEFFASAPPFSPLYIKPWAEPFSFKVVDQEHFRRAIKMVEHLQDIGAFNRPPIAWELWQVIKETPINKIDYRNYTVINDYTCDIDTPNDAIELSQLIARTEE